MKTKEIFPSNGVTESQSELRLDVFVQSFNRKLMTVNNVMEIYWTLIGPLTSRVLRVNKNRSYHTGKIDRSIVMTCSILLYDGYTQL